MWNVAPYESAGCILGSVSEELVYGPRDPLFQAAFSQGPIRQIMLSGAPSGQLGLLAFFWRGWAPEIEVDIQPLDGREWRPSSGAHYYRDELLVKREDRNLEMDRAITELN